MKNERKKKKNWNENLLTEKKYTYKIEKKKKDLNEKLWTCMYE